MDIVYLITTGLFVGFMSSFFGVGGGSLIIPILYILYPELPAQAIIPSSLGVIFINSLINNYNFFKQKLSPSRKTIINLGITCAIGAGIGAYALHFIDSALIKKLFGFMLIIISLRVVTSKAQKSNPELIEPQVKISITGFLGSFISSITGLGGGIVFVPMLISVIKLPLVYISPFSNIAMSFATLIGLIPHFFYSYSPLEGARENIYAWAFIGHVNLLFISTIFIGSLFTMKLGSKINSKVDFKIKKYLLASFLLLFAVKTIL